MYVALAFGGWKIRCICRDSLGYVLEDEEPYGCRLDEVTGKGWVVIGRHGYRLWSRESKAAQVGAF